MWLDLSLSIKVSVIIPLLIANVYCHYVDPLLVVDTVPELFTPPNTQFSVNCTVIAELNRQPLNVTIQWTRVSTSPLTGVSYYEIISEIKKDTEEAYMLSHSLSVDFDEGSGLNSDFYNHSTGLCHIFNKWGYQSILNTTENSTNTTVVYRCNATIKRNSSCSSDTTVSILLGM